MAARADREPDHYAEYKAAFAGRAFAKQTNEELDAHIHDRGLHIDQRVFAWIVRMARGNLSLYCVKDRSREPAFQQDCANDLKVHKSVVSRSVAFWEERGYIDRRGTAKVIYLLLDPVPVPLPAKLTDHPAFEAFFENWKVAEGVNLFAQLEAAREAKKVAGSDIKQIWKVVESAFEKSLSEQQNDPVLVFRLQDSQDLYAKPSASAAAAVPVSAPPPPVAPVIHTVIQPAEAETELVFEALSRHAIADRDAAREILARCRRFAPLAPVEAICQTIDAKGTGARAARNPLGLLLVSVPACFEGWKPAAAADPDLCGRCHGNGMHPIRPQDACDECAGTGKRLRVLAAH